ncbi:MAG: hypothetical protein H6511_07360 [Holophagales bacterium]|nr:hypothetical protein [Holophagales bacterium]
MRRTSTRTLMLAAALTASALALAACGDDPIARVERQRAGYQASLAGFVVREYPSADGQPGKQEILLDVLISYDGREPLEGVTLDLSMADGAGREKARRTLWTDVSGVERGNSRQVTLVVDDLPYQAGDGFWVEVRSPVPAAERGSYRELSEAR